MSFLRRKAEHNRHRHMYGLFLNTYDHYEWHDLVRVSADREKLVKSTKGKTFPLLDGEAQEEAKNGEVRHYVICEIDEI